MNLRKFFIGRAVGFAVIVIALAVWFFGFRNTTPESVKPQEFKNYKEVSYQIENETVELKNRVRFFGNEVMGDFDADGDNDVIFLLTNETGGSGTFYYAALALGENGGYKGTNSAFLGDRIAPQTTEYRNGQIIINYAERKPGEPMTARPSVGVSKYFKVEDEKLIELPAKPAPVPPLTTMCLPEQRTAEFCTQVYNPICAEVKIQCVTTPCEPIKQTFSNSCEACKNPLIDSYQTGECK